MVEFRVRFTALVLGGPLTKEVKEYQKEERSIVVDVENEKEAIRLVESNPNNKVQKVEPLS